MKLIYERYQALLKSVFGFLITLVCLILFLYQVDITTLQTSVKELNWNYLILSFFSLILGYYIRIFRWKEMLRASGTGLNLRACVTPFIASIALNNIMPFRMGDILRAIVFPKSLGIRKTVSTVTLILERIFDFTIIILCLAISIYITQSFNFPKYYTYAMMNLEIFVLAIVAIWILWRILPQVKDFLFKLRSSHKILIFYADFITLCKLFLIPKWIIYLTFLSLFAWIFEALVFYWLSMAFSLNISFWYVLLTMSISTLSTLIPSSPGYVGTFHLAAFNSLTFAGCPPELASAYAISVHAMLWLTTTIAGSVALCFEPKFISLVKDQARQVNGKNTI